jgi:hypothetical protein
MTGRPDARILACASQTATGLTIRSGECPTFGMTRNSGRGQRESWTPSPELSRGTCEGFGNWRAKHLTCGRALLIPINVPSEAFSSEQREPAATARINGPLGHERTLRTVEAC